MNIFYLVYAVVIAAAAAAHRTHEPTLTAATAIQR